MRNAFLQALLQNAAADERIYLLTADLGFGLLEAFAQRFPSRFINVGVAEQNMIGVAAGLALCGKIAVAYSIANFATLRCLEQIRNDVCYHGANVKIVCAGAGLDYGALGPSHHATEDIAAMRLLPEMTVVAPGDSVEAALTTHALLQSSGPAYLRLGRAEEPPLHEQIPNFQIGRAIRLREGRDLTLIATGAMLRTALAAARLLENQGIEARVLSMHTIQPLDADAVLEAAQETSAIVSIEEHSISGGLGSAIAEVLAENGISIPFCGAGVPCEFAPVVGSTDFLRVRYGLTPEKISARAVVLLEKTPQRCCEGRGIFAFPERG